MVHKIELTSKEIAKLVFEKHIEPEMGKGKHNFIWKIEPLSGRTIFSFKQIDLEEKEDESLQGSVS